MLQRLAQLSMGVSLYFTARAIYHTWGHGFASDFAGQPIGSHMQFHAVREVFMMLGLIAVIAVFMYGPAAVRNRTGWIVMAIASLFPDRRRADLPANHQQYAAGLRGRNEPRRQHSLCRAGARALLEGLHAAGVNFCSGSNGRTCSPRPWSLSASRVMVRPGVERLRFVAHRYWHLQSTLRALYAAAG